MTHRAQASHADGDFGEAETPGRRVTDLRPKRSAPESSPAVDEIERALRYSIGYDVGEFPTHDDYQ